MTRAYHHISSRLAFVFKTCLLSVFALCISVVLSYSAQAQFADSPCDANYYESLEARAWLEAQREITQNQNLIFKPDSVLEYTCFDRHLNALAENASTMFSETTRWGTILDSSHMDNALDNLVGGAVRDYDNANYNHDLLGGRYSGESYTPASSVAGGAYTCDIMQKVWMKAKCMNFIDSEANDGFFTFAEYASGSDKRFSPPPGCSGTVPWQDNINTANAVGNNPWKSDDVDTYLDKIFVGSGCGSGATSRIQTGLLVTAGKGAVTEYFEHVCVVPGCYWHPSSRNAGSCTQ